MKSIEIMREKRLFEDSGTGHNRWHPDIPPILEVEQNEEVILPTRDALDGQFSPKTTIDDFSDLDANAVHPLTGPVFIKGAEPGDLLEIEFLDVLPDSWAFTCIVPGLCFTIRTWCTGRLRTRSRLHLNFPVCGSRGRHFWGSPALLHPTMNLVAGLSENKILWIEADWSFPQKSTGLSLLLPLFPAKVCVRFLPERTGETLT